MLRFASLSVALLLSTGAAIGAQAAQNDMGSHWPNAVDVSNNPNWHVYVFHKSGVEYIQVNDLNGDVREVVATAGGQFMVLPMGIDASHVSTQQLMSAPSAKCAPPECSNSQVKSTMSASLGGQPGQLVYQDATVAVTVTTDTSGNLLWSNKAIAADTCQPPSCVGQQQPSPH